MAVKIKFRESDPVIWRQREYAKIRKRNPDVSDKKVRYLVKEAWKKEAARRKAAHQLETTKRRATNAKKEFDRRQENMKKGGTRRARKLTGKYNEVRDQARYG